jgi:hypothetical protein
MKWIINKKTYNLPFTTKETVLRFINTDFKVCPHCSKIDCSLEHVSDCSPVQGAYKKANEDNLWK